MVRALRPVTVFGLSGMVGVALTWGGTWSATGFAAPAVLGIPASDPNRLQVLEQSLYYVDESYVEQQRIDWDAMYDAALDAVERKVPGCLFRREARGQMVAVEVGEYHTVLELPPIGSRKALQEQLQIVARMVRDNLDVADIPVEGNVDPHLDVELAMINGMLSTLDPHSYILPPEDARQMDSDNHGEFGGLGITVQERNGRLAISEAMSGSPAEKSGLLADDEMLRIDGESTLNMTLDDAVKRLRGQPKSKVRLQIRRAGVEKPFDVDVTRELIANKPVEGQLLPGNIGWIRIPAFNDRASDGVEVQLTRLSRDAGGKLSGLILDLRDNPGGYLREAEEISDLFLSTGDIVSTVDGYGARRSSRQAKAPGTEPEYPMVVLVSASSASASEIVAGALRNHERAVVIGERTFGKGSVQNLHDIGETKLKITISQYLTPGDRSIQSVGIPADIEMVPTVVRPGAKPEERRISLYARERVRREASLDHHLDRSAASLASGELDEPAFSVRYLAEGERGRKRSADVAKDPEVALCRDVLAGAKGWRRSEILSAVAPVVDKVQAAEELRIQGALKALGMSWEAGPTPAEPLIEATLDLGPDGRLVAGTVENVALVVKNMGTAPIYRLSAVSEGGEIFDGREFVFGKVDPGQTVRFPQIVDLTDGWPEEIVPVTFQFRTPDSPELAEVEIAVQVDAKPLPRLTWAWQLDDHRLTNGDGILQVGERVAMVLEVRNEGLGVARRTSARLQNRSGKAVDLGHASVSPGSMKDATGAPCVVVKPGVEDGRLQGEGDFAALEAAGQLPEYAPGCERSLAPGESWTGEFQFTVVEAPKEGPVKIELAIGDGAAYDVASVSWSGFWGWYQQVEKISLNLDSPLPVSERMLPPTVEISRRPALRDSQGLVSVSGEVVDDRGVASVVVFVNEVKVFTEGGGPNSSLQGVPFTADFPLKPGSNVIAVLATDNQGLTSSSSVVTWYDEPEAQAKVE